MRVGREINGERERERGKSERDRGERERDEREMDERGARERERESIHQFTIHLFYFIKVALSSQYMGYQKLILIQNHITF